MNSSFKLPLIGKAGMGLKDCKELQTDYGLQWYDYKVTFPDINFMLYDHISQSFSQDIK